ncbi:hypothetical protein ACE1CI_29275 [Aerosakkonemataceae cyanobacterium BLCC-F50]|uniref:Uncharacterized protein n=1 Tax=Floridaenema flaviceps BLCC-F50 TaxID=3153642 RepID=A0ABV4XZ65_9CYAN
MTFPEFRLCLLAMRLIAHYAIAFLTIHANEEEWTKPKAHSGLVLINSAII